MGISKKESERLRDFYKQPISHSLTLSLSLLIFCFILTSCTSIRPVIKIGLLAPFEGLQRRSGYVALTAMRQAIADRAPTDVAIMPLALDSGADPAGAEQAARKLLQDDAVGAIIGPYTPLLMTQLASVVTASHLPWFVPFALDPTTGFVMPDVGDEWAFRLLTAAAETAAQVGSQRLLVAGWTPGWPPPASIALESSFALPLLANPDETIQSTDAVFWLGDAKEGALYFTALRERLPAVPFLLPPHADDPIFSEQTQIRGPVYLLSWRDDGYEQWRTHYPDQPPIAYLTYRATATAISQILGETMAERSLWHIQTIALDGDRVR